MVLEPEPLRKMFRLLGEDRTVLAEIIESYLLETPPLIEVLRYATAAGDPKAVGIAAHSLKSTAQDMGASTLSVLCRDVEMACHDRSQVPTLVQLNKIAQEAVSVVAALELTLNAIRDGAWHHDS